MEVPSVVITGMSCLFKISLQDELRWTLGALVNPLEGGRAALALALNAAPFTTQVRVWPTCIKVDAFHLRFLAPWRSGKNRLESRAW